MTVSNHLLTGLPELFGSAAPQSYTALMEDATTRIASRAAQATTPATNTPLKELAERVETLDLDAPGAGGHQMLAEIEDLFLAEAVWFHDPGYLAHLNCPVDVHAVAAEAVLAAVNPSVDTYDQSRIGTLIERRLISWAGSRIGFPHGDGIFTSGGTQSNLQALFLAREAALAGAAGTSRAVRQQQLTVLTSAESHFSIAKSALLLGLAEEAVVPVPTSSAGRMDPLRLKEVLAELSEQGRVPMAVVATAGTTDRGVVDPLEEIAAVCRSQRIWLHVDAAYGCGLLVSERHRHLLAGIEQARSVTLDFHKTFFQPVSSSALVLRDATDFSRGAWHADYLNPAESAEPNQVDKSLQTTRRFDALKLLATLRGTGAGSIGRAVDAVIDLAGQVHELLEDHSELQLIAPTDLSTVLFRWQPPGVCDQDSDALVGLARQVLQESGRVMIAKTVIDSRPCMKLTLLNPEVTLDQVAASLEEVATTARILHRHRAGVPEAFAGEVEG